MGRETFLGNASLGREGRSRTGNRLPQRLAPAICPSDLPQRFNGEAARRDAKCDPVGSAPPGGRNFVEFARVAFQYTPVFRWGFVGLPDRPRVQQARSRYGRAISGKTSRAIAHRGGSNSNSPTNTATRAEINTAPAVQSFAILASS